MFVALRVAARLVPAGAVAVAVLAGVGAEVFVLVLVVVPTLCLVGVL